VFYDPRQSSIEDMDNAPKLIRLADAREVPALVSALVQAFSVGSAFVGIYDEQDYLRYANDAFLNAFSIETGQTVTFSSIILDAARSGRGVRIEASDPLAFIDDAQKRRRVLAQAPRQRSFAVDFMTDQWFWCTETLLENGWIVLTGADITPLKQEEMVLSAERDRALLLSGVDELTGVPNRRSILARLDAMLHGTAADDPGLCVALLDLDHFKSINDTFGHETGDTALRHFAQHGALALAAPIQLGRLGGEEFLALFPAASCDEAKQLLERILLMMPPVSSRLPAHVQIRLTFSAGLAQPRAGETRDDLLARADQALYRAKQLGRSRVEIYRSPLPDMHEAP
jgi:diguanylate cyclase (GGDEF)-like protein